VLGERVMLGVPGLANFKLKATVSSGR
jgi:hypothetical protein